MVITRKEKNGFGKDVNKTLELIAKLPQDIKDAVFEYLKGYSESNPVMNEIIETAIQAVAESATTVNNPVVVEAPLIGVTPVSTKEVENISETFEEDEVPLNDEQLAIVSKELKIPMDKLKTDYGLLTTRNMMYTWAMTLHTGAHRIYA